MTCAQRGGERLWPGHPRDPELLPITAHVFPVQQHAALLYTPSPPSGCPVPGADPHRCGWHEGEPPSKEGPGWVAAVAGSRAGPWWEMWAELCCLALVREGSMAYSNPGNFIAFSLFSALLLSQWQRVASVLSWQTWVDLAAWWVCALLCVAGGGPIAWDGWQAFC